MNAPEGVGTLGWACTLAGIGILLAIDLVSQRRDKASSPRAALIAWLRWIGLASAFGVLLWIWRGPAWSGQFFAGYITEAALSADNLLVFVVIFATFAVRPQDRPRILQWGVIGALLARGILIAAGIGFIDAFWWASYALGTFVIASGVRIGWPRREGEESLGSFTSSLGRKLLGIRATGGSRTELSPMRSLLRIIVLVELVDLAFALDSVPAVLGLTRVPYLVFTSNAFAVLGLRSLFFVIDRALRKLRYLHVGLAAVMVLVGLRMLLSGLWEAPLWLALSAIASILTMTALASWAWAAKEAGSARPTPTSPEAGRDDLDSTGALNNPR